MGRPGCKRMAARHGCAPRTMPPTWPKEPLFNATTACDQGDCDECEHEGTITSNNASLPVRVLSQAGKDSDRQLEAATLDHAVYIML